MLNIRRSMRTQLHWPFKCIPREAGRSNPNAVGRFRRFRVTVRNPERSRNASIPTDWSRMLACGFDSHGHAYGAAGCLRASLPTVRKSMISLSGGAAYSKPSRLSTPWPLPQRAPSSTPETQGNAHGLYSATAATA